MKRLLLAAATSAVVLCLAVGTASAQTLIREAGQFCSASQTAVTAKGGALACTSRDANGALHWQLASAASNVVASKSATVIAFRSGTVRGTGLPSTGTPALRSTALGLWIAALGCVLVLAVGRQVWSPSRARLSERNPFAWPS